MAGDKEVLQKVVKIFDKLLAAKGWQDSPLLKVYHKRFTNLKKRAVSLAEEIAEDNADRAVVEDSLQHVPEDSQLVYVSLYQADGSNLHKWAMLIRAMATTYVGRPVHDNERMARALVESKPNPSQEGYIVVRIKTANLLEVRSDHQMSDALGNPLLSLNQHAITINGVVEFVHANTLHYRYVKDQLVLKTEESAV